MPELYGAGGASPGGRRACPATWLGSPRARPDTGGAVLPHRSGAVLARAGAAAEGTDEARARAPSVPRQVRAAARRGVPEKAVPAGRNGVRPLLRVRDDARRG